MESMGGRSVVSAIRSQLGLVAGGRTTKASLCETKEKAIAKSNTSPRAKNILIAVPRLLLGAFQQIVKYE
jgi:hypothetical protein